MAALFVSEDPVNIRLAAKILEDETNPNIALTDLAALILYRNYQANDEVTTDANAWILKALKISAHKRYLSLLSMISANTENEKLSKYLDETIDSLRQGDEVDPSSITKLNYDAIKVEVEQTLAVEPFPYSHIDTVNKGDTVKVIYEKLGYPTNISNYVYGKRIPFAGTVKVEDTELFYAGSGSVRLRSLEGDQLAFRTIPEKAAAIPTEGLADLLEAASGQRAVIIAKQLNRSKDYSIDLVDAAANKIWMEKASEDRYMVDAIAWLCKYIGASSNGRYTRFIENLVNTTENKKILKYAKSALKGLPAGDGISDYKPSS